jgi:amidase
LDLRDYSRYDAVGLRDLVRARRVSPAEVEAAARAALEAADAELNALAVPLFEAPLDAAPDGPLAAVPFLIKDSGPMAAGVPFHIGSRSLRGVVADHDSELMRRFRAAGLLTLGLTAVPEFALSFATESVRQGATRNPWATDRGAGGSSGGSAALVAAGAVPMAHGNDGAGSLRVPASCCGLVGLKPTRGRTPSGPDIGDPLFGLACEFALTRTVRDAAHLLDAVHGNATGDRYIAPPPARPYAEAVKDPPAALRVAVTTHAWSGAAVDPQIAAATARVGRLLEKLGHAVEEATPAVDPSAVVDSALAGAAAVGALFLTAPRPPDPNRLEAVSRRVLEHARRLDALGLMALLDAQHRLSRSVGAFLADHDLLVTPTLAQLPAPHGTLDYDDPGHSVRSWLEALFAYGPFTAVFNATGQPAVSLPLGHSADGLPIGVQLVAPYGREDVLLGIAGVLEQAMPWADRVPAVHVGRRPAVRAEAGRPTAH